MNHAESLKILSIQKKNLTKLQESVCWENCLYKDNSKKKRGCTKEAPNLEYWSCFLGRLLGSLLSFFSSLLLLADQAHVSFLTVVEFYYCN